jgi:phosphopantothenoylcysteine decarboxylase/phosphopantothenate--cysteine ligase
MLKARKILLGVSGSIAAYKSALLVRLLVKEGCEVKVILTGSAAGFITPLTLATLSRNPVITGMVKSDAGEWNNHVELGLWADAYVVAPASANTLAKCAAGLCDNMLTAVYLSARCPVFFAPAMDLDMYQHPATRRNLSTLLSFGNGIIPAQSGELASGLSGEGRMAEPEDIVSHLRTHFASGGPLTGKTVLVTAGPTYEAIDPVRFVGNHSTGKMGYALARYAAERGAKVYLVSGPTHLTLDHPAVEVHRITSAQEMYEAAARYFSNSQLVILAAAVADYTPRSRADQKIKKKEAVFSLELEKTIDIAATLGQQKQAGQMVVGFALETENEQENALKKLRSKNMDLVILNSLRDDGAGFGHETNRVTIFDREGGSYRTDLLPKSEIAQKIVDRIIEKFKDEQKKIVS